jgi:hypothetical protein
MYRMRSKVQRPTTSAYSTMSNGQLPISSKEGRGSAGVSRHARLWRLGARRGASTRMWLCFQVIPSDLLACCELSVTRVFLENERSTPSHVASIYAPHVSFLWSVWSNECIRIELQNIQEETKVHLLILYNFSTLHKRIVFKRKLLSRTILGPPGFKGFPCFDPEPCV